MTGEYIVHGAAGTGSVMVEAALTLLDLPYRVVESTLFKPGARPGGDPALTAVNPMGQLPALILPSGELMTESSAILIWLADDHPEARLAPTMASAARPPFLRWMAFASAAIYSLFWIRDDPSRLTSHKDVQGEIKARTADRIAECWRIMEAQVDPGRYILGHELTVLDIVVTVMSRWTPRRRRFYEVAPKLSEVVRRVDAEPRLQALWAARFPFEAGWEG
ncbi:MAG TPA: glutathione S-transferase family protein [Caulobacteraceae bacterium]|nr:glutathione S-transferase family protein [Caulobacteraceae bacterium]